MSLAGILSGQGDAYQVKIASWWVVQLLFNDCVTGVQVESTGMPGDNVIPSIDDIVVEYADGRRVYIQAKKNQRNHKTWTLGDSTMKHQLMKARDQLKYEDSDQRTVRFYSRSPFGKLQKLAEHARSYPDLRLFESDASRSLKSELTKLANHWETPRANAYALARRLYFTTTEDYEELDLKLTSLLAAHFERPEEVRLYLENIISDHQLRLRNSLMALCRADVESRLRSLGHIPSPNWTETELLATFKNCSIIGRSCIRDIEGHHIKRSETDQILNAIEDRVGTVLIKGEPGIGKTCILLDVVDKLEEDQRKAVLFVKGDQFVGAQTFSELAEHGLPNNIIERCAQLAKHRHVIVLLDSLDTLSLQRPNGSFQLFLSILDRLATIRGVTVVTTCRNFDLEYEPKLRGRNWDREIMVKPLRVESDLIGILNGWNIKYANLDKSLQEQLRVPSRLWIFAQLHDKTRINTVNSVYELHLQFLENICSEPDRGEKAWDAITRAATLMHERRRLQIAQAALRVSPDLLHFLLSRRVLIRSERAYAFGHQEFLDIVLVRAAIQNNKSLVDFATSQPALPFIRPTIRVYLHVLRAIDRIDFKRAVRAFLDNGALAYHLKRLVAESLAEMQPVEEDLPLLRYMMQSHEDLFKRFIGRAVSGAWLDTFVSGLLPEASSNEEMRHLVGRILRHLGYWVTAHPEVVLPTWKKAIEEQEASDVDIRRIIANGFLKCLQLADSVHLPNDAVEWLIQQFVNDTSLIENAPFAVGPLIRVWVEAHECDDVLLSYLGLGMAQEPEDFDERVRSLITEDTASESSARFLSARMSASVPLIDAAMKLVLRRSATRGWSDAGDLLNQTSWIKRHYKSLEPEDILVQAFEMAILVRASRGDTWWLEHESRFRTHENVGMRYLVILVYRRLPQVYYKGISALLTDPITYEFNEIESEVRELANVAYPYLSETVSRIHQALLLAWAKDETGDMDETELHFYRRRAYEHIIWIPKPYLTEESIRFLMTCSKQFDPWRPTPRSDGRAGFVPYPISPTELQRMSDEGILQLIAFFGTKVNWWTGGTRLEGGWQQLKAVLADVAMNVPVRAIEWTNWPRANQPYRDACIEGIATHVLIRYGRLEPSGKWDPVEPMPDGITLCRQLIQLIEIYSDSGIGEQVQAKALWACTYVLDDDESTGKLTLFLGRLAQSEDPDGSLGADPPMEALNSVRGLAARGAVILARRLVERGHQLQEPLKLLLRQFIQDCRPGVRLAILYEFPLLTRLVPDLAWPLLADAASNAGHSEWEQIEKCLYYNYRDRYSLVEPILNRLRTSALDIAGRIYGRIATLSMLSNHLGWNSLFTTVVQAPSTVWDGAIEVLAANLIHQRIRSVCECGLVQLLNAPNLPKTSLNVVVFKLSRPETKPYITKTIVETLVARAIEQRNSDIWLEPIFDWIAGCVQGNALAFLGLLEKVVRGFENGFIRHTYNGREMVAVLAPMLREADESDDQGMILRVLELQDRLLQLGFSDVDRMLDEASRP